jgi:hypothetical protein
MTSVWSLLDIMKLFSCIDFAMILVDLQKNYDRCIAARGKTLPEDELFDLIKDCSYCIHGWKTLSEEMGIGSAHAKISLTARHLEEHPETIDCSSLAADLRNAYDSIMTDVFHHRFVHISREMKPYVNNEALFGQTVNDAFPKAVPDIREAGNCLAVDNSTAAVFHLMRAVEHGLLGLCAHLGIVRIPKRRKAGAKKKWIPVDFGTWDDRLKVAQQKIDNKVDKLKPGKKKQELQQFYYPLLQDLKGFKDAWRNHVMHSRDSYSAKDAEAIMDHVKNFMIRLSEKVSYRE